METDGELLEMTLPVRAPALFFTQAAPAPEPAVSEGTSLWHPCQALAFTFFKNVKLGTQTSVVPEASISHL